MAHSKTIMISGQCAECGAIEIDGYSCDEQFHFPLAWEHADPDLYALHFWLVSCYMIQHPSHFTEEGYSTLCRLFKEAYDHHWETDYILKKNSELVESVSKITNPAPLFERKRNRQTWSMTINDVYSGGEACAVKTVSEWKKSIRNDLQGRS